MNNRTIANQIRFASSRLLGEAGNIALYHLANCLALPLLPGDSEETYCERARHYREAKRVMRCEIRRGNLHAKYTQP